MVTSLQNQYIDESYKDLIQLGKTGAGSAGAGQLPAYDGAANLIWGRLGRLHPLDVDPNTVANGTFECVEPLAQAALETAGWVFDANLTGSVSRGRLVLVSGASGALFARFPLSMSGDFDLVAAPAPGDSNSDVPDNGEWVLGVSSAGTGMYAKARWASAGQFTGVYNFTAGEDLAGGSEIGSAAMFGSPILRVSRASGTLKIAFSQLGLLPSMNPAATTAGWEAFSTADTTTWTKILLGCRSFSAASESSAWYFLRRYV